MKKHPFQIPTQVSRVIGRVGEPTQGPTLLVIGGMHGNEPAGVLALERLFLDLEQQSRDIRGSVIGLRGNLPALEAKERFLEEDLNRIWTSERMGERDFSARDKSPEEAERKILGKLLEDLLLLPPPVYIVDLHTTSAPTRPFLIIDDTLLNRTLARQFPLPVVLGLDEYLPGTLLSFYRSRGLVTLGMEAGQHEDENAVTHCHAFLWLLLHYTGSLQLSSKEIALHGSVLEKAAQQDRGVYDIWHREGVKEDESFEIADGFYSFQKLPAGTRLGSKGNTPLLLKKSSRIFMPRYQPQGSDGYFLMRRLQGWLLEVAEAARRLQLGALVSFLPGVRKIKGRPGMYRVPHVLFQVSGKGVWHFLGYRIYRESEAHWRLESRDQHRTSYLYKNAPWNKKGRLSASP